MTESEWLACTDPTPMLGFLKGKASDRKLRLFACASCRRIWHLLVDERFGCAVEIAERFADGIATARMCQDASEIASSLAGGWAMGPGSLGLDGAARFAGLACAWAGKPGDGGDVASMVRKAEVEDAQIREMADPKLLDRALDVVVRGDGWRSQYLRDLFGPGLLRPMSIAPSCVTPTVKALAQSIYNDRTFGRLPTLADELVKSGYANAEILGHCREPGPHVRGCWVVDLVLGKE